MEKSELEKWKNAIKIMCLVFLFIASNFFAAYLDSIFGKQLHYYWVFAMIHVFVWGVLFVKHILK